MEFAELARREAFNEQVGESIRSAILDRLLPDPWGRPAQLIDFGAQTAVSYGPHRVDASGWTVDFEVEGVGSLYRGGETARSEDKVPCVCRGTLEVTRRDGEINFVARVLLAEVRTLEADDSDHPSASS